MKPTFQGFGSRIIHAGIEHQLGGGVVKDWHPAGLSCRIVIPIEDNTILAKPSRNSGHDASVEEYGASLNLTGNRILVVEDESLVALALVDVLKELGYDVIGPCSSVSEALNKIETDSFDAAILDLNLNGEMIYPAAEILQSRNITLAGKFTFRLVQTCQGNPLGLPVKFAR